MTLREYLDAHGYHGIKGHERFAALIGVEKEAVYRWASGVRIPYSHLMVRIAEATGHKVLPGSFFPDLPAVPPAAAQPIRPIKMADHVDDSVDWLIQAILDISDDVSHPMLRDRLTAVLRECQELTR